MSSSPRSRLASLISLFALSALAAPYAENERVVFFGDSITHNAYWCAVVSDYYYTRFPERTILFHNAGVGGDTAGGCMRRITEDVTPWKPSAMTVMFGMNDARISCYNGTNATPQQIANREAAIPVFREAIRNLAKRLKGDFPQAKITWFAPSPYDDTVTGRYKGSNAGVGACAKEVCELVTATGDGLVEMFVPMTAFNLAEQKTNPKFTLCGTDGVHPREAGGFFMARQLLAQQGAPAEVASVVVTAGGACQAKNADISNCRAAPDEISFTCREKSLPCPILPAAGDVAKKIGFADEFNREMFVAKDLPAGDWRLEIDGCAITTRAAAVWAQGVNLADGFMTPQLQQAQAVAAANRAVWAIEDRFQNYSALRHFMFKRRLKEDCDNFEKVAAFIAANREKPEIKRDYFAQFFDKFLEEWPKRAELRAEIDRRVREIRRLAQPQARQWRLVRVGPNVIK